MTGLTLLVMLVIIILVVILGHSILGTISIIILVLLKVLPVGVKSGILKLLLNLL
jgi:hypothetical protein